MNRYDETIEYLHRRIDYERMASGQSSYRFRLKRMRELLSRLQLRDWTDESSRTLSADRVSIRRDADPPPIPLIHIAGTKGKGSTAAMAAAMLTASGRRTGLYTSPHLHRLEERFRIDGEACDADELVDLVQSARELGGDEMERASFFEFTTALAMLRFQWGGCDAVVLEVGLGGRLDSTNVCRPSVSVITSIGLDHQHVLGDTVERIAAEKAGIIKAGVPVVSGVTDPGPAAVIEAIAAERHAPLRRIDRDFQAPARFDPDWGSTMDFRGARDLSVVVPVEGAHQARNAALAIAAVDRLGRRHGLDVPDSAIESGLRNLRMMARLERFELPGGVIAIVDAAHNHDSIAALCSAVERRRGNRTVAVVFGTSIDKDAREMLTQLRGVADHVVLTRFHGNPRFTPIEALRGWVDGESDERPIDACIRAIRLAGDGGMVVVCGSFFLAAETRMWFRDQAGGSAPS